MAPMRVLPGSTELELSAADNIATELYITASSGISLFRAGVCLIYRILATEEPQ